MKWLVDVQCPSSCIAANTIRGSKHIEYLIIHDDETNETVKTRYIGYGYNGIEGIYWDGYNHFFCPYNDFTMQLRKCLRFSGIRGYIGCIENYTVYSIDSPLTLDKYNRETNLFSRADFIVHPYIVIESGLSNISAFGCLYVSEKEILIPFGAFDTLGLQFAVFKIKDKLLFTKSLLMRETYENISRRQKTYAKRVHH